MCSLYGKRIDFWSQWDLKNRKRVVYDSSWDCSSFTAYLPTSTRSVLETTGVLKDVIHDNEHFSQRYIGLYWRFRRLCSTYGRCIATTWSHDTRLAESDQIMLFYRI